MLSMYSIILCGILQIDITVRSYPEASWLTSWSASISASDIFFIFSYIIHISSFYFTSFSLIVENIITSK